MTELLLKAVIDNYERGSKASRDYPRKKEETPPGALSLASHEETNLTR